MSGNGWPMVPLGKVLTLVKREASVEQHVEYDILGAHWYAKGLYTKERKPGSRIKASKLYRVQAGDFVYNRLFAWKGSFAVASTENDGCFVSNEFPCFDVNKEKLDPSYLWFYFSQELSWTAALGLSYGATPTSRNRLKESHLLSMEIPLPPLSEQRRIVAKIERLAGKIEEGHSLKAFTLREVEHFWKMASRIARSQPYPSKPLEDFAEFLDGRRVPLSKGQRASRQGEYPYYGASGIIDHLDDYIFDEPLLLLSEDGANLLNRSTPIAFIADGKYWVNNHAHVLRPLPGLADLRFITYAISDYDVTDLNFASAQPKLNQKNARTISIPLPPLAEQRRIVAYLDGLQAKVDELKRLQAETAAELDALLPAVLDRAFKGEL